MSLLGFHTWRYVCCIFNIICLPSDELCASIVRSHRETSQYRVEELQALRWKLFSREEIQTYQNKVYQPDGCFFFFFGSHTPFVFVWHYSVMQSQSITCHFRWLEAEATFDSSKRKLKELVLSFSPSSSSPSLIPQNDYVQFKFNDLSDPQKNDLSLAHTSMLHLQ